MKLTVDFYVVKHRHGVDIKLWEDLVIYVADWADETPDGIEIEDLLASGKAEEAVRLYFDSHESEYCDICPLEIDSERFFPELVPHSL